MRRARRLRGLGEDVVYGSGEEVPASEKAIVDQIMAERAAQGLTTSTVTYQPSPAVAQSGIPKWMLIGGVALIAFMLLRK